MTMSPRRSPGEPIRWGFDDRQGVPARQRGILVNQEERGKESVREEMHEVDTVEAEFDDPIEAFSRLKRSKQAGRLAEGI